MGRSYDDSVSHPNREQPPKKIKKQFNKKVRKQSKRVLSKYILGEVQENDLYNLLEDSEEKEI